MQSEAGSSPADATEPVAAAADTATSEAARPHIPARDMFGYAITAAVAVLAVFLLALAVYALRGLLVKVAVAAFIAVSLDPAVRWLIAHKIKRSRAVALIVTVVLLLLAGFGYATIPTLIDQAGQLGSDFPGYLQHLRERSPSLARLEDRFNLQPRIASWAHRAPSYLSHEAVTVGTRFFGALVTTLLVVVLAIYFMADLPRLRRGIVRLFPKRHRPQVTHATTVMIDKVGAYMIGNLIISLIAGVSAFIVMEILRVPFALPLAVAVAITDLIPLIGATIGAAVCVLVAFATTDLWPNTVVLVVFFLVYQQVENYFIQPRVMRNAVDLSSVAVLLAALIGASMLGVIGALMAIPVAAAIRVVVGPVLAARDGAGEAPRPAAGPTPASVTGSIESGGLTRALQAARARRWPRR